MIANGNSRTSENLSTPRFDENASANARPVKPIGPIDRMLQTGRALFAASSRSLALVVLLGIATGTLAGMAMVSEKHSDVANDEQTSVLTRPVDTPQLDTAEAGVYEVGRAQTSFRRSFGKRTRIPGNVRQRAYRFAVIR